MCLLAGKKQGGPMYFILSGLGKKWIPMAMFFMEYSRFHHPRKDALRR